MYKLLTRKNGKWFWFFFINIKISQSIFSLNFDRSKKRNKERFSPNEPHLIILTNNFIFDKQSIKECVFCWI